ncbi:glycoside hydrolase family 16 protein [Xylaria bambusicola]|uniref:glycoside hydrolase family 16 protein n=1 Tax=Xylaria bambusicola TaxID=326684 RepID=UPI0020080902|nr:glycoside hydrolase family 16 protein [Xylaria bambusicola]KAI0528151.1 glycoside hydrolase family 16 protein [Xylaria bambusicola]
MRFQATLLPLLPSLVAAIRPPNVNGMNLAFFEAWEGPAGSAPNTNVWNIMDSINTNNEVQTYSLSNNNLQISGGGTVQFVPRKSSTGQWTSARIESKASWTPTPGKVMMVSANILVGSNAASNKQGMWPAFWLLGDAVRHGTEWPACGEIDIFEQVNGVATGHGTLHCGSEQGGPCQETTGRSGTVPMPLDGFHTWSVKIDLTNGDWRAQTISFQVDGNTFYTVSGADLNDAPVWSTLAHSPMYMIFNVAVGGNWPGAPNAATLDGYGAMMEVQWAAVYTS